MTGAGPAGAGPGDPGRYGLAAFVPSAHHGAGLGHIVRCREIARALGDTQGWLFLGAPDDLPRLTAAGIEESHIRPVDIARPESWLAAVPGAACLVLDMLHSGNAPAVARAVAALHEGRCRVVVIDSMPPDHFRPGPDRAAGPGGWPDLLVTPYVAADRLRPPPGAGAWACGPRYAVLSDRIRRAASRARRPARPLVLVACGGRDPGGLSLDIGRVLAAAGVPADIVVGPQFEPDLVAGLTRLAQDHPTIRCLAGLNDLSELLERASLVVGRPGLLRYEVAMLGLPALYLWEGEDYRDYFAAFAAATGVEICLASGPAGRAAFLDRLSMLTRADALRQVSPPRGQGPRLVDGEGAHRIARAIRDLVHGERRAPDG